MESEKKKKEWKKRRKKKSRKERERERKRKVWYANDIAFRDGRRNVGARCRPRWPALNLFHAGRCASSAGHGRLRSAANAAALPFIFLLLLFSSFFLLFSSFSLLFLFFALPPSSYFFSPPIEPGFSRVSLRFVIWVLLGFYWVLLGYTGFLLGFTGFYWVLLGFLKWLYCF